MLGIRHIHHEAGLDQHITLQAERPPSGHREFPPTLVCCDHTLGTNTTYAHQSSQPLDSSALNNKSYTASRPSVGNEWLCAS